MANINKVALLNNGKVVGAGRNKDNSNLAPIEATTTASRSYLVGDYLMLQGEFYKVISAISIGDTLTVGTNIQATSVGDEVSDINDRMSKVSISLDTRITLEYDTNYVTLTDGYFRISTFSGNNNWGVGYVNGQNLMSTLAPATPGITGNASVFVRKGTTISYKGLSSSVCGGYFYPLS